MWYGTGLMSGTSTGAISDCNLVTGGLPGTNTCVVRCRILVLSGTGWLLGACTGVVHHRLALHSTGPLLGWKP